MAKLNINGTVREVSAEADTPLLWVLRDTIGLTGTKYGCGIAQCGCCTVHIDGVATRSCQVPVGTLPTASGRACRCWCPSRCSSPPIACRSAD